MKKFAALTIFFSSVSTAYLSGCGGEALPTQSRAPKQEAEPRPAKTQQPEVPKPQAPKQETQGPKVEDQKQAPGQKEAPEEEPAKQKTTEPDPEPEPAQPKPEPKTSPKHFIVLEDGEVDLYLPFCNDIDLVRLKIGHVLVRSIGQEIEDCFIINTNLIAELKGKTHHVGEKLTVEDAEFEIIKVGKYYEYNAQ